MATIEVPDHRTRTRRFPWAPVLGSLLAAGLFLASGVLQLTASLQRWVVFRGSRAGDDVSAEDHLFDYSFPYEPWEPIGTAAQLYGLGYLFLALGVLAMPLGLAALTRTARRRSVLVFIVLGEIVLAIVVSGSFAIHGVHALISGFTGVPSPLQHSGALSFWVGVLGLVVLAVLWRRSRAAVAACVFLIGATDLGYLLAAFVIAPVFAGGTSHDTTPWTETVVAASTVAAGIAMIVAALETIRHAKLRAGSEDGAIAVLRPKI